MKKIIIIPIKFKKEKRVRNHNRQMLFFEMLRDELGFDLRYTQNVEFDKDTEILISYGWEFVSANALTTLANLSLDIILIHYSYDFHWVKIPGFKSLFDRADLILEGTIKMFKEAWPQYIFKRMFFPNYLAPISHYAKYDFNSKPIMKCLLSGQPRSWYPMAVKLGEKIKKNTEWQNFIDILGHPRFPNYFHTIVPQSYENYGALLHKYFCCIAAMYKEPFVTAKCLEIPAVGSLLLTERNEDLDKMGFIPWKHYIPITWETIRKRIEHCLENPNEYQEIRKEGMRFVRENHSVNNRFQLFTEKLRELI